MKPQDLDRKASWRALTAGLGMPDADTQAFLTFLEAIDPAHGIRAAMIASLSEVVGAANPDARAAYDAYDRSLPKTAFFSFMPIMEVAARFGKAAMLLDPTRPLIAHINDLTRACVVRLGAAPFMQAVIKSAEGDLSALLRGITQGTQTTSNYGAIEVDHDAPGHMRLLYRDHYPLFARYYICGAILGNCDWFGVRAEATFSALSDTDFSLDLRW